MLSSGPADLPNLLRVSAYEEMFGDMLQPEVLAFRLDETRKMGPNVAKAIDRIEKQIDQLANVKIVRRCAEKNSRSILENSLLIFVFRYDSDIRAW